MPLGRAGHLTAAADNICHKREKQFSSGCVRAPIGWGARSGSIMMRSADHDRNKDTNAWRVRDGAQAGDGRMDHWPLAIGNVANLSPSNEAAYHGTTGSGLLIRIRPPIAQEAVMADFDKKQVASILNAILEQELAGVVRYTHYSFLIFGLGRIPIVAWLRAQADESLTHAHQAGEMLMHLGAYPSLKIGALLDRHSSDIEEILQEALGAEAAALALYRALLDAVLGHSVMLEEYARQMIFIEELHAGEVKKMLQKPGAMMPE